MDYTHINLTSQERMNENDDDVVVVLSLCDTKYKFLNFNFQQEFLKKLIISKDQRHSIISRSNYNNLGIRRFCKFYRCLDTFFRST